MSHLSCRSCLQIMACVVQGLFPQSTHHQRCQRSSPQRLFPQSARLDRRKTLVTPRAHPNRRTGAFRARHCWSLLFFNSFLLKKNSKISCFACEQFMTSRLVASFLHGSGPSVNHDPRAVTCFAFGRAFSGISFGSETDASG